MSAIIYWSIESGMIFAIMALGVYLSFRILDFPDLTVDGSFVSGAAITAVMIVNGYNPFIATLCALFVGLAAGILTGILHTKAKINPLLSGILVMTALYSLNLRIMGKPNIPLLNNETIFNHLSTLWQTLSNFLFHGQLKNATIIFFTSILTFIVKFLLDWFLKTDIGLALRATGNNKRMIRSFSGNTDHFIILGLGISNALVALSGGLFAQYNSFTDVSMGVGMIIVGLASVIIGEAILGTKTIFRTTLAVICGAIVYRLIVSIALSADFLQPGDMRLITACIVIVALVFPKLSRIIKDKKIKKSYQT